MQYLLIIILAIWMFNDTFAINKKKYLLIQQYLLIAL